MNDRLLNISKVEDKVSMSRTTIWRKVKTGKFPPPTKIDGLNYWRESVVNNWIDSLEEAS